MKRVLFICTANAGRSQLAAGLVNHDFGARIRAFSAGIHPKPVSKLTIRVLAELGIDTSDSASVSVSRYDGEQFDYVIFLCEQASNQCRAHFPGARRICMGFPDTPHTNELSAENIRFFQKIRDAIRRRLQDFFAGELQSSDGSG